MAEASSVHVLAKEGDVKALTIALKSNDANVADGDGMRPLHYAAWYGNISCLTALLTAGADINAFDHDGATPSHAAAYNGQLGTLVALIEAGADLTITDNDNAKPSQVAGAEGHGDIQHMLELAEEDQRCEKVLLRMEEAFNEAKDKSKQCKATFSKALKDAKKRVAEIEKEHKKLIKNTLRNKRKKTKTSVSAAGPVDSKLSFSQMAGVPASDSPMSEKKPPPSAMRQRPKTEGSASSTSSTVDLEMLLAQLGADHGDEEALTSFLASLDLQEFARIFQAEKWTLEQLVRADAANLKKLGLPSSVRKKILNALHTM
eukprot:TRINITY_DN9152_c1_g2_i1.p1 TRINITY_DN9152_c1_g2~~TRINITY_DN9152_c1_g2_i1.p1  ORF type:complete len:317 (+),score=81.57 TRINITY_DN9152_c1_g2_i1:107-1057(+)